MLRAKLEADHHQHHVTETMATAVAQVVVLKDDVLRLKLRAEPKMASDGNALNFPISVHEIFKVGGRFCFRTRSTR